MPIDSATVAMFERMGAAFGVPIGWIAAGVGAAHLAVSYVKQLSPDLFASNWYPAIAGVVSVGYAYTTLKPAWLAVAIGSAVIFVVQWFAWGAAKRTAAKAGMRGA